MTERGSKIRQGIFAASLGVGAVLFAEGLDDTVYLSNKISAVNVVSRSMLPTAIASLAPAETTELKIGGRVHDISKFPHPRPTVAEYWLSISNNKLGKNDPLNERILIIIRSLNSKPSHLEDRHYHYEQAKIEKIINDLYLQQEALLTRGLRETAQTILGPLIPVAILALIRLWNAYQKRSG